MTNQNYLILYTLTSNTFCNNECEITMNEDNYKKFTFSTTTKQEYI